MSRPTPTKASSTRRPLSVWELPTLLQPVHRYRKTAKKPVRERPHFRAILAFVHRNRFAVASQIQRRFPQQLPSDRTARRHLAQMELLGYLGVVETNGTSPLWPKVYFVTRRGLARLRNALKEKGQEWTESAVDRRRSSGSSSEHVLHELFTTEFLLMVWQTAQARTDLEILTIQRRSLAKHDAFKTVLAGRQTRLQPDGMFLYRQQGKGMMACFVETDVGTMNAKQMAIKMARYHAWAQSADGARFLNDLYRRHGATNPTAAFRLLIVVGDRTPEAQLHRMWRLLEVGADCPSALRKRMWICTADRLRAVPNPAEMLVEPLWCRPAGISDHECEFCINQQCHKFLEV